MNRSKESALTPSLSPREKENRSAPLLTFVTRHSALRTRSAFTLVEMLVVISIIGILAALIIGVLPSVTRSKVHSRVRAEMTAIETVVDGYKQKKGFYPPGTDTNRPTLYYELTGQPLTNDAVKGFFRVQQIANSG